MNSSYFPQEITTSSMIFLWVTFLMSGIVIMLGIKKYRFFLYRFSALLIGVLFFEFLTSSLWVTAHLGTYGYINGDVSIVLSLYWTSVIFIMRMLFDTVFPNRNLMKELGFVLGTSTLLGLITIIILKEISVFSYSPELQKIIDEGFAIFGRPIESLIYFPVFIFVTYSFYKYWELAMYNKLYFLNYSLRPKQDVFIAIGILITIGYLMHPLFGSDYIFVYPLLILGALLCLVVVNFTISFATGLSLFIRYLLGTLLFALLFGSLFSTIIGSGWLNISESLKINYTTATIFIPGFNFTDSEAVGIMFFSYLLIACVKYYKVVFSHNSILIDDTKMTFRGWRTFFWK